MTALQARLAGAQGALTRWRRAFDSRIRRERILLMGAAIGAAAMAMDQLWLTPAYSAWKAAGTRHAQATTAMQQLNQGIVERGAQARAAEQQLQRDLAAWREKVQQGDADLRKFGTSLVNAADMLPMLDHMLAEAGGLRLRNMQSLARTELATPLMPGGATAAPGAPPTAAANTAPAARADTAPVLYRHGVELTVEGSYADLLGYLHALEAMPQRVLWGGVQMKVEQYPKTVLTLRLYTLSMNRGWLEL